MYTRKLIYVRWHVSEDSVLHVDRSLRSRLLFFIGISSRVLVNPDPLSILRKLRPVVYVVKMLKNGSL